MESSTIKFSLKENNNISIKIFDTEDHFIEELLHGNLNKGSYSLSWDCKDNRGISVEKGVYYYHIDGSTMQNSVGPIFVN